MRKILLELKRYIISPLFSISVAAALCLIVYPCWGFLKDISLGRTSNLYYISLVHSYGTFDIFAPAIAAIPCGAAFYNDYSTGYLKAILPRTSRVKYLFSKILICAVTGGLALALPNLMYDVFLWIAAKPHTPENGFLQGSVFESIEFQNDGLNVMLILLLLAFLFGAAWSLVGLAMSAFIPNKFAAIAAPFMIYFALSTLLSITDKTFIFSPINMLFPDARLIPSLTFCFIYEISLIIFAALLFIIRSYRRLKNAI